MAPNPSLTLGLATGPLRIHISTPDPIIAGALGRAVALRRDVELTGAAADADVILWDGGADPDGVADRLAELDRLTAAVALLPDERWARAALSHGARGALLRSTDGAGLLAALIAARHGLTVLDASFALADAPALTSAGGDLTPREHEVLALMADGLSNKEIGQRLTISDHTAKFHVNGILGKLGAQTRTEAVVVAARRGVLTL